MEAFAAPDRAAGFPPVVGGFFVELFAEPLAAADAVPAGFAPGDFGDFPGDAAFVGFAVPAAPALPDAGPDVPASARDVVGLEPVLRARPDDERPSPRDPPAPRPPGRAEAPGVDGRRFEGMVPIVPSRGPRPPQGPRRAGQRGRIHTKRSQPAQPRHVAAGSRGGVQEPGRTDARRFRGTTGRPGADRDQTAASR